MANDDTDDDMGHDGMVDCCGFWLACAYGRFCRFGWIGQGAAANVEVVAEAGCCVCVTVTCIHRNSLWMYMCSRWNRLLVYSTRRRVGGQGVKRMVMLNPISDAASRID